MRTFLSVLIFYGTFSLWAQVHSFLSVDFQNDFLDCRGHGTDRYYTAGNFLTFSRLHSTKNQVISFSLVQQAFTPSDLQDTVAANFDYPYAGLLFLEGSFGWSTADKSLYVVTTASIGQTGKYSGVAGLQRTLHRVFRDEMPQGWNLILEQGVVAQTSIDMYKTFFLKGKKRVDFTNQWEFGTIYKNVRLGIYASIGYVPPFSIRSVVTPASFSLKPYSKRLIDRVSVYFIPTITWVFSNLLLEQEGLPSLKNLSRSSAGVLKSRVLGMEGGLAYTGGAISVLCRQHWKTAESQSSKPHHFGGIAVVYNFPYKSK
jgi:Uncharacterized protein conserved in bacteria (DUF2219)